MKTPTDWNIMFQKIQGRNYYVVDLKELPELPISDDGDPALTPYAEALTNAIKNGTVQEPGKYAIAVNHVHHIWTVFKITE